MDWQYRWNKNKNIEENPRNQKSKKKNLKKKRFIIFAGHQNISRPLRKHIRLRHAWSVPYPVSAFSRYLSCTFFFLSYRSFLLIVTALLPIPSPPSFCSVIQVASSASLTLALLLRLHSIRPHSVLEPSRFGHFLYQTHFAFLANAATPLYRNCSIICQHYPTHTLRHQHGAKLYWYAVWCDFIVWRFQFSIWIFSVTVLTNVPSS